MISEGGRIPTKQIYVDRRGGEFKVQIVVVDAVVFGGCGEHVGFGGSEYGGYDDGE